MSRETQGAREFRQLTGFSKAADLQMSLASTADYERAKLKVPKPGEYCQDNGMIAAVTSKGEIVMWVPQENPRAPRTVSHEEAIQSLERNGFTAGDFAVPKL